MHGQFSIFFHSLPRLSQYANRMMKEFNSVSMYYLTEIYSTRMSLYVFSIGRTGSGEDSYLQCASERAWPKSLLLQVHLACYLGVLKKKTLFLFKRSHASNQTCSGVKSDITAITRGTLSFSTQTRSSLNAWLRHEIPSNICRVFALTFLYSFGIMFRASDSQERRPEAGRVQHRDTFAQEWFTGISVGTRPER